MNTPSAANTRAHTMVSAAHSIQVATGMSGLPWTMPDALTTATATAPSTSASTAFIAM